MKGSLGNFFVSVLFSQSAMQNASKWFQKIHVQVAGQVRGSRRKNLDCGRDRFCRCSLRVRADHVACAASITLQSSDELIFISCLRAHGRVRAY